MYLYRPVYSDTTQLDVDLSWVASAGYYRHFVDATRRLVELSCVAIDTLTDATQLRRRSAMQLTQLNSVQPISAKQVSRVELRRLHYRHFADATQLDSTSSCVAINGPLDDKHLVLKVLRHGSHSLTCNNTMPAFSLVLVHQIAPPGTVVTTSSWSLLLIYRSWKDERLSWLSWLTYSGRFTHSGRLTHMSGHPSAVGRAQDSESSPVKDQRSTAEPWNQHFTAAVFIIFHIWVFFTICSL